MDDKYITVTSCLVVGISLLVLSILAVSLRTIIRWRTPNKIDHGFWETHLDDVLCLLSLLPSIGTTIVLIYGSSKGIIGGHNDAGNIEGWMTTTTPDLIILEKLVYIIFIMQPLALGFMKLSVLFFYRRIFIFPLFDKVSLFFIIFTVGWMLAFFFGFIFDCRLNFSANWGSLASIGENCPFGFMPTIIFTVIDAFLDLCILIIPLPCIWVLKLPVMRKVQVCAVFLLGGFAVSSATVRMVVCIKQNTPSNAVNQELIMGMPPYDIVGITSYGLFWTVVEVNVALIACCLPSMRALFTIRTFRSIFGMSSQEDDLRSRETRHDISRGTAMHSNANLKRATSVATKNSSYYLNGARRSIMVSPSPSEISLVELEGKYGVLTPLEKFP